MPFGTRRTFADLQQMLETVETHMAWLRPNTTKPIKSLGMSTISERERDLWNHLLATLLELEKEVQSRLDKLEKRERDKLSSKHSFKGVF